jgi:hypothetical protein
VLLTCEDETSSLLTATFREHLYRSHRVPKNVCARCGDTFSNPDQLSEHLRLLKLCDIVTVSRPVGVTGDIESALKNRSGSEGPRTEKQKWYDAYRLFFPDVPDDALPSPCKVLPLPLGEKTPHV